MNALQPLIDANLDGLISLRERLALAPKYFHLAGLVGDLEVVDTHNVNKLTDGVYDG
jgi:hypothetical protein